MASFAVISACYTNIAISVTFQRDTGVLKRINGTPLPSSVYLGARMMHALFVAVLLVAITAAFGRVLYGADIPTGVTLLRFLVVLRRRRGRLLRARFRYHRGYPQRRCRAGRSQRGRSCRCCSCPGSSSRSAATRPRGSSGSPGYSRCGISPSGMQAGFLGTPFHWTDVLYRRRLGPGRPAFLGALLQLGAAQLSAGRKISRCWPETGSRQLRTVRCRRPPPRSASDSVRAAIGIRTSTSQV